MRLRPYSRFDISNSLNSLIREEAIEAASLASAWISGFEGALRPPKALITLLKPTGLSSGSLRNMTDPNASINELRPEEDELMAAAAKGWFMAELEWLREAEEEEELGKGFDVQGSDEDGEGW
jgi:hypothetical protein